MSDDDPLSAGRLQGDAQSLTAIPDAAASTPRPLQTTDSLASTRPAGPGPRDEFETLTQIGRFRNLELIGHGGFGFVYRAYDPELNRSVALKVPRPGLDAAPFLEEARSAAPLKHANIVTVYDVGRTETGQPFIALEYVDGPTLSMLMRQRRLTHREAAHIVAEIARGVHFAHRAGIVHRDLKPGNILIDQDGTPKVTDFGLALHESAPLPDDAEVAGTPAYMAPEQVTSQAGQYDGRTDIWALGVILYQLLSGRLPFAGHSERETLYRQICLRDPKPLRQIDDSIPVELADLCRRCLAKSPVDRPTTALDVSEALDRFCQSSGQHPAAPQGLISPPAAPASSRLPAWVIAAAITALGAPLLLLWWQTSGLNAPVGTPPQSPRSIEMPDISPVTRSESASPAQALLAADSSPQGGVADPTWETLKGPYQPLFWRMHDAHDSFAFDTTDGRLAVQTQGTALFTAGTWNRDSFTLRTEVNIQRWEGRAGLFWEAHEHREGGIVCMMVLVGRARPDSPLLVQIVELRFDPNRPDHIHPALESLFVAKPVAPPQDKFPAIEVTVDAARVKEVRFGDRVVMTAIDLNAVPIPKTPIVASETGMVAERGLVLFKSFQARE